MHTSHFRLLAAAAVILGIAACDIDPEQAPPFAPTENLGTITGLVYLDANGNGTFDPVAGDDLLAGTPITLSARGDSSRVLLTTTSSAEGSFTFQGVPVGTHELRARLADGTAATCAPVPVTVYVAEAAFASAPARLSCRIDIQAAKAKELNAVITVAGIVTAEPNVYRANNLYLQDSTGGMQVFGVAAGSGIVEGDSIELTGALGQFGQERQMINVTSLRIVRAGAGTKSPRARTIAEMKQQLADSSVRSRSIGELVVVRGVRPVGLPANNSAGSGTDFRLVRGTDTLNIRLDVNANTNIPVATFAGEGKCFDVVGILGFFSPNLQLKPRRVADVTEVTCPAS